MTTIVMFLFSFSVVVPEQDVRHNVCCCSESWLFLLLSAMHSLWLLPVVVVEVDCVDEKNVVVSEAFFEVFRHEVDILLDVLLLSTYLFLLTVFGRDSPDSKGIAEMV